MQFKTQQEYFDNLAQQYIDKHHLVTAPLGLTGLIISPEGVPFPQGVSYQFGSFDFGTESCEYHFGEQYLKRWYYALSYSFSYEHRDRFGDIHHSESFTAGKTKNKF